MSHYRTILIDPPWPQSMSGQYKKAQHHRPHVLPYPTMTLAEIEALPIPDLAAQGAHLWLWTTNQFLRDGFDLLDHWGFKYLAPITWLKPSGIGNWFVHRTQTLLFGYRQKCQFNRKRYLPTILETAAPTRHSAKPAAAYELIESISDPARVELFARHTRPDWDTWGNEVPITISSPAFRQKRLIFDS